MQKTTLANSQNTEALWYLVDATDQVVGRLATRIATVLMGKHKPTYTPFMDTGDHVVVTNCEKVVFSGSKDDQKVYRHHTLYPGGLKTATQKSVRESHPDRILFEAVKRMLPKTKLARQMIKKLRIYAGTEHPHGAQQLQSLDLKTLSKGN